MRAGSDGVAVIVLGMVEGISSSLATEIPGY